MEVEKARRDLQRKPAGTFIRGGMTGKTYVPTRGPRPGRNLCNAEEPELLGAFFEEVIRHKYRRISASFSLVRLATTMRWSALFVRSMTCLSAFSGTSNPYNRRDEPVLRSGVVEDITVEGFTADFTPILSSLRWLGTQIL